MQENMRQSEKVSAAELDARGSGVSVRYVAGAVAVFAAAMLLVGEVHRHRTKATDGCLMDGEARISMQGTDLVGDNDLPSEYRAVLADALRSGQLAKVKLAAKEAHAEAANGEVTFELLVPLATTVISDQPLFDWEDLDDAEEYRLTVWDADGKRVAESPALSSSAWRPSVPLDHGKTYHWSVTAVVAGRTVTMPAAGQPEATFRVAAQDDSDRLMMALAKFPDHHLMLAALYGKAGDTQAARRELDSAQEQNGSHPMLSKLRASLGIRPRNATPAS